MIDLQAILTYLTLISVPVGVFYHIMTLNNTRKNQRLQLETRQAQLFMQLYQEFSSVGFVKQMNEVRFRWSYTEDMDFDEWFASAEKSDEVDSLFSTVYFFEGLGVLVKKGLIDAELVDDLMSAQIIGIWERLLPLTNNFRRTLGPQAGEWYEYLYDEIKPIYLKQHPEPEA